MKNTQRYSVVSENATNGKIDIKLTKKNKKT